NSKGHIVVLNHPGSAASGPLYGNSSTQLLLFDQAGKFVREIGKGVYGLGYSHSVRFDKYDNLWVVDKGTNAVVKFNPAGYVTMNLGRRPDGPDDPSAFYYTGRRGNRRIQVVDTDGKCLRMIHLNVPYDKKRHPVLGNLSANPPDETAPWTICITPGPTQYLYTTDQEPGRIYKLALDGKILGMLGESGRDTKQFNWVHGLACPSENELIVADMNNWRVQEG